MTNEALRRQYLWEVKRKLHCPPKLRKQFLAELDDSLSTFLDTHGNATMADVRAHFGSSAELATSYLEGVDQAVLQKQLRITRTVCVTVIALVAAIVLLSTAMAITVIIDNHHKKTTTIIFDTPFQDGSGILSPEEVRELSSQFPENGNTYRIEKGDGC